MNENTGYKVASRIVLRKTTGGKTTEKTYNIGYYTGDRFVVLSQAELSAIPENTYRQYIADTIQYIAEDNGIRSSEIVFNNEPVVKDHFMCPLPLQKNNINAVAQISGNRIVMTYTASNPVASDVVVGVDGCGKSVIKQGTLNVSSLLPDDCGGRSANTLLYVGEEGVRSDGVYEYGIQPIIEIPEIPVELVENNITLSFNISDDIIRIIAIPDAFVTSPVVIRFTTESNGAVINFDVSIEPFTSTGTGSGIVPESFYGKNATVKLYSVNGIPGADRDNKYYYTLPASVKMPDFVDRENNVIGIESYFSPGVVNYKARSIKNTDSDVTIGFYGEDQFYILPYITIAKGDNEATGKANSQQYGKDFTPQVYAVNGVEGIVSDDIYRYSFDGKVLHIPSPLDLPDNSLMLGYTTDAGQVTGHITLREAPDADIVFFMRPLGVSGNITLKAGQKEATFVVPAEYYNKNSYAMIDTIGNSYKQYHDVLWDSAYKYNNSSNPVVIPQP